MAQVAAAKAKIAAVRAVMSQKMKRHVRPPSPYLGRPVAWIREKLHEFIWSKQIEIAQSVADNRRTAVQSCHEVGKSFIAARLVAWWLDVHPPGEAFVVTSAPSAPQVRAILWREINRAHAKGNLAGRTNQTEWWLNGELVAFGRKPNDYEPTAFQGIHARYVLVILDEACGIPKSLYQAAMSLVANEHSRFLAIGNPDDATAYFEEICRVGTTWNVIRVDGLESPNFTDEWVPDDLRDLLIGPTYVAETLEDCGDENHPLYRSKVRGLFTQDITDGVIPLSWIEKCKDDRELTEDDLLPVEIGFDVAAGGDEAVLRCRRGITFPRDEVKRYREQDSEVLVGYALQFIIETGATSIKVDVIGVGWAVYGRLEGLRKDGYHSARVYPVNVGEASTDPKRWPKLRDQIWWECGREVVQHKRVDLRELDDRTIAQLVAVTAKPNATGQMKVEPKAETKKKIHRSPDDADAWLLSIYQPPVESMHVWRLGRGGD